MNSNNSNAGSTGFGQPLSLAPPGFGQPLPKGVKRPNGVVKSVTFLGANAFAEPATGVPSEQPGGKRRRRRVTKKRRNSRRRRTRRHR